MHGVAKALLKSASVIALLWGGSLLLASAASAQFPIPNIQFRVPYIGGGGGGGGGHYRSRHHKAHERKTHGQPDEDNEPAEHEKSGPQQLSAPIKDTPPPQPAQPPQGGGSPPAPPQPAVSADQPTFSPSR